MRRVILGTASGAVAALVMAVIVDTIFFDIPARQRGEIHEPSIRLVLAATLVGAICAGLVVYKWGRIELGKTARYIAVGALLGVFGATIAGLVISNTIPLSKVSAFKVFWLEAMVPVGAALGVLTVLVYRFRKQRRRTDDRRGM